MKRLALTFAFILLGGFALISQVLFIREFLVVFHGNELCLGTIFAGWLFGISLGAWISSKLINRFKEKANIFLIMQILMGLLLPIQIYFIRITREILRVPPGEYIAFLPMLTTSLLIILPLSILVGGIFPFACKIFIEEEKKAAISIGWVYILEAIGSVTGGLVLTFYLITHFLTFQIIALSSLLILASPLILLVITKKSFTARSLGSFCFLLLLFYGYLLLFRGERIDCFLVQRRWESFNNGIELLESLDSKFQNIAIGRMGTQYSIFGNGQYISSFPDKYRSAIQAHLFLCQHPHPQKVLLVGGGMEGVIREILKYPINKLDYVEIDPRLIQTVSKYLLPEDKKALRDKRVQVFYSDGRYFVKESLEKYDLIILNFPDPSTAMLNRFYTVDFFKEVKRIMDPAGVLVTGVSSAVNYIGQEVGDFSGSIYHSLKAAFPYLLVTPGETNYFFATCSPHIISSNPPTLARRYLRYQIKSEYFSPFHFKILLPEDRVKFIEKALRKRKDLPRNTDWKPISYFYNLVLWDIFSQKTARSSIFQKLSRVNTGWFFFPLIIFLLLRVSFVTLRPAKFKAHLRFNCLFAIFTTGFAAMAFEIILIFSFQSIYGYLYQKVGLIIAMFMLGLALGGYLMNRILLGKLKKWIMVLLGVEMGISGYAFLLPSLLSIFFICNYREGSVFLNPEYLFISLVGGAGVLTGLEFPLVSKILLSQEEAGVVAGVVDSFDHLGACLGAALAGTLLVPLLGIKESCFLVGTLNLLSAILLFVYLFQKRRTIYSHTPAIK
jgi:spermidine synthase